MSILEQYHPKKSGNAPEKGVHRHICWILYRTMYVQNIFLAFLPLGQASMRTRRSALALFGYGNEWLQTANQERG